MPYFKITIKGKDEPEVYEDEEAIEFVKQKLDQKYSKLKDFASKAWGGLSPFDKAAMATAPIPVVGDIAGLVADADMYMNDPESRTLLNAGLTAAGLIPFVPALSTAKKVGKTAGEVLQESSRAADLPMDQASRMKRAEEMGFDPEKTWIHATDEPGIKEFDPLKRGDMTLGSASDPAYGMTSLIGEYFNIGSDALTKGGQGGSVLYPAKLPIDEDLKDVGSLSSLADDLRYQAAEMGVDIDDVDDLYYDLKPVTDKYVEKLKSEGYSGVKFSDEEYGGTSAAIFDPENIRSVHAAFDPAKKQSANILAGGAGATVGTAAYMSREEDQENEY
jgi:hypothetical protein